MPHHYAIDYGFKSGLNCYYQLSNDWKWQATKIFSDLCLRLYVTYLGCPNYYKIKRILPSFGQSVKNRCEISIKVESHKVVQVFTMAIEQKHFSACSLPPPHPATGAGAGGWKLSLVVPFVPLLLTTLSFAEYGRSYSPVLVAPSYFSIETEAMLVLREIFLW